MLRLIFGRSGSGKTQYALEKANELAMTGRKIIFIVPEQFTFEMERSLVTRYGAQSGLNIEVLSFSRLSHRVFKECGGLAHRYIDDSGRMIIMQLALKQISDMLKVYQRQAYNPAFVKTMVETAAEYKTCGITDSMLESVINKTGDDLLRQKLSDLSIIMSAYNAILEKNFADPLDDLTRLADKLSDYPFFQDKSVIIDSFKGFTPQEKKILIPVLKQAEDVIVTLCADQAFAETANENGLFSSVGVTAEQLIRLANQAGAAVAKPEILTEIMRFRNGALRALEEKIFRPDSLPAEWDAPQIHIFITADLYGEVQFAAQRISSLIRSGLRYRDIVVIARDLEMYSGIIEPIFEKYQIPFYLDSRKKIDAHPLMAFVLSAIEIILSDFRYESIFRCLKTGLAGFDITEISELENYVLTWNINGFQKWSEEWHDHPDGFSTVMTAANKESLNHINKIRQRCMDQFTQLKEDLNGIPNQKSDGVELVTAVYSFLIRNSVPEAVQNAYDGLMKNGEQELADEYRQIYGKLIELFDQLAFTLKDHQITLQEFREYLQLVIENADMGHIPPSLDEVMIGDAERIRTGEAKYAFIIGIAEGVFPKSQTSGGILSDSERKKLIELGLEISPPAEEKSVEERYIAYKAFTSASDEVYLSCPLSNAGGKTLRPSYFLTGVQKLFPLCDFIEESTVDPLESVQNPETAYELAALRYHQNDPISQALKEVLSSIDGYQEKLEALCKASVKKAAVFRDKRTAKALFGDNMHISPSRLETFRQCRFLYFCRYGMNAYPRKKAELAAPEIGTVIHFVLERLLSEYREVGLWTADADELAKKVKLLLDEFSKIFFGGLDDKPERFKYLYLRLESNVLDLVMNIAEELKQSEFIPVDFELEIRSGGDITPFVIPLDDGGSLIVEGKIDRVDLMKKDGVTYVRVIDYKTGSKEFNLSDILYGLNLQMLIYLFTLCDHAKIRYEAGDSLLPAGVLYVPAKRPVLSAQRGEKPEKIRLELRNRFKMNGLLLNNEATLFGMEQQGLGRFINARSSLASLENFGVLKNRIQRFLSEMATSLQDGDVAAIPTNGMGYHPCDYCDYVSVCGHESGDPDQTIIKFDQDEVWKKLREDEENGRTQMDE